MGNSLLDFVMALVRDPDAAARYAADPAGALAEAHLPGITATDVANLIPVVTDSLAMTTPDLAAIGDVASVWTTNVWTSGAAAAALDAFDVPHPAAMAPPAAPQVVVAPVDHVLDVPDLSRPGPVPDEILLDPLPGHPPLEPAAQEWADEGAGPLSHDHQQVADHHPAEHSGFDLF